MKVEVKLVGMDNVLETLKSLPPEVVSKNGGVVKLSLAKGARLIRNEVGKNLEAVTAGEYSTGFMRKNLVVTRGKKVYGKGEKYLVRFRRKAYPDRGGKSISVQKIASFLEYGTEKQKAEPFIRPAVISKGQEAINVITEDLLKRIDKIVKKQIKGR